MKVLLVHPGASSSTCDVEAGLRYGLKAHGVDVIPYRLDLRMEWSEAWLDVMWQAKVKDEPDLEKPNIADVVYHAGIGALEMALRHSVDVVLVVSAMLLHPDVIVRMKQAGLRVTVLFTESPYDLEQELKIARLVDGCWTNERASVAAFQAVNGAAGYLPHGWHPEHHGTGEPDPTVAAHDVVFVGTAFRERVAWFNSIDWTGIDLGLYGNWPDDCGANEQVRASVRGGVVGNLGAVALYRRAQIGLNLYRDTVTPAESLNPRAYELAQCGVFHVSEYRAEVREVFGELVPTFTRPRDAEALIRRWLARAEERRQSAARLPSCVAHASWTNRSQAVVRDLSRLVAGQAAA